MNLRTTLFLVALAGVMVVAFIFGDAWAVRCWNWKTPPQVNDPQGTAALLESELRPETLTRIEIRSGDRVLLVLERRGSDWAMPGGWPLRKPEVEQLVQTLTQLRTRFAPIPLANDSEEQLRPHGLATEQKPLIVQVLTENQGQVQRHTLTFGQPELRPGDNPFVRPVLLRWNTRNEVVVLGPDVLPILRRPAEFYRSRTLFPDAERLRLAGSGTTGKVAVLRGETPLANGIHRMLTLQGPQGRVVLQNLAPLPPEQTPLDLANAEPQVTADRLADTWVLAEPIRDRLEPNRLRQALTAIPELWVERFLVNADGVFALAPFWLQPLGASPLALAVNWGSAAKLVHELSSWTWFQQRTGLHPPAATLALTSTNGTQRILHIGAVSRSELKPDALRERRPQQMKPDELFEEYRYATLQGDALSEVFEIRSAPLRHLFPGLEPRRSVPNNEATVHAAQFFRDPQVVRFDPRQVRSVTILPPKNPAYASSSADAMNPGNASRSANAKNPGNATARLRLKRTPANPNAPDPAARVDRWTVQWGDGPEWPADVERVNELLRELQPSNAKILDWPKITDPFLLSLGTWAARWLRLDPDSRTQVTIISETPRMLQTAAGADVAAEDFRSVTLELSGRWSFLPRQWVRVVGSDRWNWVSSSIGNYVARPELVYRAKKLWDLARNDIEEIEVRQGTDAYRLQPTTSASTPWLLRLGERSLLADAKLADDLADALSQLQVVDFERSVQKADEWTPQVLASYGLDTPASTIRFRVRGVGERVLVIGSRRPNRSEYFAKQEPGLAVFTIDATLHEKLTRSSLAYRPLELWNFAPLDVVSLRLQSPAGEIIELNRERNQWQLAGTPPSKADSTLVEEHLKTLAKVSAVRYQTHSASNLAEFGLQPNQAWKVSVVATAPPTPIAGQTSPMGGSTVRSLWLGAELPQEPALRYARWDDANDTAVFVVSADLFRIVAGSRFDWLDRQLLRFNETDLLAYKRIMNGQTLELKAEGDAWQMLQPRDQPADSRTMENLARRLGNLRAERVEAVGMVDLAKYQLDRPSATVTLSLADSSERVLRIGKPVRDSEPTGPRYALLESSEPQARVVVLSAELTNLLLAEPLRFRDRTLTVFPGADQMDWIRFEQKWTFRSGPSGWSLSEPFSAPSSEQNLTELHSRLAKFTIDEFVSEKPSNLREFGLDAPQTVWRCWSNGKELLHLQIGNRSRDGTRAYGKLAESDFVFLLDAKLTELALSDYRPKALWAKQDAASAKSLRLIRSNETLELVKNAQGVWTDPKQPQDRFATSAVNELLDTFGSLQVERYVLDRTSDRKPFGLDAPVMRLEVEWANRKQELWLGQRDETSKGKAVFACLAPVGDRIDVFTLSESTAAKLDRRRADLLEKP